MNIKAFSHILESIKPYTDYIYFHLMGEPFLNDNLEQFLKLSEEYGFKVNITTNGTLINKVSNILLNSKALRQINFSLHSFEANDNQIDFNEYLNNILEFINIANRETKTICALRLWNLDGDNTIGSNQLNYNIFKILQDKLQLDYELRDVFKENNSMKLKDRIYLNMAEKFDWPNINLCEISDEGFCYGLRDQIGVLVDGTVVPCCLDSEGNISLGNILEKDLQNILEDDRAKKIYDGFSNRKCVEKLCKRCGYIRRF
jgi:radical SAM protein with 4Fe4S-binding SPASM domain